MMDFQASPLPDLVDTLLACNMMDRRHNTYLHINIQMRVCNASVPQLYYSILRVSPAGSNGVSRIN